MRSRFLSILMLALATALSAQDAAKQPTAIQPMGERDKLQEDAVAKLLENIRADAKLPPLTRIRHRDEIEQLVCTIALKDAAPPHSFGIYKTARPDLISTELNRVAFLNQRPKYNPSYERYSVAVWRVKDPQTAEIAYWVGVRLYWSELQEFVDYHFTDDVFYHNLWQKNVAPQCRGK
jgi:hypothetical protein